MLQELTVYSSDTVRHSVAGTDSFVNSGPVAPENTLVQNGRKMNFWVLKRH